jgi:hypothetical protein
MGRDYVPDEVTVAIHCDQIFDKKFLLEDFVKRKLGGSATVNECLCWMVQTKSFFQREVNTTSRKIKRI